MWYPYGLRHPRFENTGSKGHVFCTATAATPRTAARGPLQIENASCTITSAENSCDTTRLSPCSDSDAFRLKRQAVPQGALSS